MTWKTNVKLNIHMKPVDVLIIKDIEIINQNSDLDNFCILDLQKSLVKILKNFVRRDKKNEKKSSSTLFERIKDQNG